MRKTFRTYCPGCEYKIEYQPLPGFRGELRCPHCGHDFKLPTLFDFTMPTIVEVLQGGDQIVPIESRCLEVNRENA